MNKYQEYQEALTNLKTYIVDYIDSDYGVVADVYLYEYYKEEFDLLQKLVDKETPKKIIIKKYGNFNVGDYYCPHCNCKINEEFEPKYCSNCGGSIDWMV